MKSNLEKSGQLRKGQQRVPQKPQNRTEKARERPKVNNSTAHTSSESNQHTFRTVPQNGHFSIRASQEQAVLGAIGMKRTIMPPDVAFTVPGTPPSVNRYVRHTRSGRHYKCVDAVAFERSVLFTANGQKIRWPSYCVHISIYFAAKQKGDLDNFAKCTLDAIVKAGVIDTDAKIVALHMFKFRDASNPRTEILVQPWVS